MVAVENPGGPGAIYVSTDSGRTWNRMGERRYWQSVAISSDGNKIVAAEQLGFIYTFKCTTTVGTSGSISGGQYETVELQYMGNDLFNVLSYSGSLVVE
jgi:photosystem II stability/assembly factor-like uncharacterized protein